MKHVFYLDTCSSCRRILRDVNPSKEFSLQNIKDQPINETQLNYLASLVGSYEALFNKQARKYRELELFKQELSEGDYKSLILKEYTFLKRPIFVINTSLYICKNKASIVNLKDRIKSLR
jgi:arsenate reductase (glutaredoxin)